MFRTSTARGSATAPGSAAALRTTMALGIIAMLFVTLTTAAATSASAAPTPAGALLAEGAWIRETPPNRDVAAGYVTLTNTTSQPLFLTGGASTEAGRVEIHSMSHEDGMMRMRHVEQLEIKAGATATLEPGGLHLMLFEVDATRAGRLINVDLLTSDGTRVPITFPVRTDAPRGD